MDVALLPWGQDLLDGLLAVAARIMRAIPAATRQLLECVNAIAAAAPSKLKVHCPQALSTCEPKLLLHA